MVVMRLRRSRPLAAIRMRSSNLVVTSVLFMLRAATDEGMKGADGWMSHWSPGHYSPKSRYLPHRLSQLTFTWASRTPIEPAEPYVRERREIIGGFPFYDSVSNTLHTNLTSNYHIISW